MGSFSQNVELLNLLPKRGPQAFEVFCVALRETKQGHLEDLLLATVSDLQHVLPPVRSPKNVCSEGFMAGNVGLFSPLEAWHDGSLFLTAEL